MHCCLEFMEDYVQLFTLSRSERLGTQCLKPVIEAARDRRGNGMLATT
jgi:hypothetical protein